MPLYRSKVVTIGSKRTYDERKVFFIGGEPTSDILRIIKECNLVTSAEWRGRNNIRYVTLPAWAEACPSIQHLECVRISEFDRRICSQGGGIPHVDEQLRLY